MYKAAELHGPSSFKFRFKIRCPVGCWQLNTSSDCKMDHLAYDDDADDADDDDDDDDEWIAFNVAYSPTTAGTRNYVEVFQCDAEIL